MFARLARRVTVWYVSVAVLLVLIVVGAAAALGFTSYAHATTETLESAITQVPDFEPRARQRRLTFVQAAAELQRRLQRPGIIVRILPPIPMPPGRRVSRDEVYVATHAVGRPEPQRPPHRAGPRRPEIGLRERLEADRVAGVLTSLLGMHPVRSRFLDGLVVMYADPARVSGMFRLVLYLLVPLMLAAGLLAWLAARQITARTIRPLIEVTQALQRFAGRDFSPHPVGSQGGGDFEPLARAYNAAAQQVAAAFAERRQTEERMRQFVADAGHELRTPLTIVLGYLEMLRRHAADDEKTNRMFATIGAEGARMRVLVDNLVLLAKMEGTERRDREPFDIGELVDAVVEGRRLIAPGVALNVEHETGATVIAERAEVHEALGNVVDNALKYAPGAAVTITVAAADGAVELRVADRGPGIAPEDRDHVFERFYRGRSRGEVDGSGLGLAIARLALERAGGTLAIAETSPSGTTFVLRLRADQVRPARPHSVTG